MGCKQDGNAIYFRVQVHVESLNGHSIASNTDATKVVGPDVKQKTKELCLCMRMMFVCMSFSITDAGCCCCCCCCCLGFLFPVQSGTSTLLSRFSEVAVAVLLLLAAAVAAWG